MVLNDNFGCQQKLKDILPQSHFIDIRVRLNGKYYWFEGGFLKHIFKHVSFKRVETDADCKLNDHEELSRRERTD
jgi:hypothetical protein